MGVTVGDSSMRRETSGEEKKRAEEKRLRKRLQKSCKASNKKRERVQAMFWKETGECEGRNHLTNEQKYNILKNRLVRDQYRPETTLGDRCLS